MCVEGIVGKLGLLNAGLASAMGLGYVQTPAVEMQGGDVAGTVPGPGYAQESRELGYEAVVLVVGSWLRSLLPLYRGCTVDVPSDIYRKSLRKQSRS